MRESQVYPLGENTSFEQGAMTEPVACCLHGMDLCGIRPGHQVVVIGGGMIGLIMVQLAKLAGAAKVALLEPVKKNAKQQRGSGRICAWIRRNRASRSKSSSGKRDFPGSRR